MREPPAPSTWRITLPRSATAVPIARAMVRTAMQDLRATADRTTAQLLAAELVSNALEHTRDTCPIELVVELRPTGCRIEVHDGDPALVQGLGSPLPLADLDTPAVMAASSGPTQGPDGTKPARRSEEHRAHGRGLLLIRSLSSACGCRPIPRGKAVWFTLPELQHPHRR
ncbi:ATP-binding protein [Streptomyces sp. NPDC054765]